MDLGLNLDMVFKFESEKNSKPSRLQQILSFPMSFLIKNSMKVETRDIWT